MQALAGAQRRRPQLSFIVADLRGPIYATLVGYISSVKVGPEASRARTRFLHVPDGPVITFMMMSSGGKRGLVGHASQRPHAVSPGNAKKVLTVERFRDK